MADHRAAILFNELLTIIPSDNLTLNWSDGNFNFKPVSTLNELHNDVNFLMALKNNLEIKVGGSSLNYNKPRLKDNLEDVICVICDLYEIFKSVNIVLETRFSDLLKQELLIKVKEHNE